MTRELHGTIVANISDTQELHFLTSDGTYYRILKNKKHAQLKSKANECMHIAGYVTEIDHAPTLEITSFESDFVEDRFADDIKSDNDDVPYRVSRDTFIDYESFIS